MRKALAWLIALGIGFVILSTAVRSQYEVPILMYHRVDYPNGETPGLFVTPPTFERQMQFLRVHHYQVVSLEVVIRMIKSGKDIPMNTVVITFDDGYLDNFNNAFPTLKKMGFPATIFMITDNIGKEGWLGEEDLRVLDDSDVTLASHTVHHTFLPKAAKEEVIQELAESKARLEKILGHPVTLFSYPAGGSTPDIAKLVEQAGYEGAVTTNYGKLRHDPYRLHRIKIGESRGSLFSFWVKTTGLYQLGKRRVEGEDYEFE